MKIFPAVHYTMGGLWASFTKDEKTGGLKPGAPNNMSTNIPGLYTMGECLIRLSWGHPPGGELTSLLHLRRAVRRTVHQELLHGRRRDRFE